MGTNYYAIKRTNVCEHCGRGDEMEELHIGKYSAGWCFAVHVDVGGVDVPSNWEAWKEYLRQPGIIIRTQYGMTLTLDDMVQMVEHGKGNLDPSIPPPSPWYGSWAEFHSINNSQFGPNGLIRSKIINNCVGHGSGTWDLRVGEFS